MDYARVDALPVRLAGWIVRSCLLYVSASRAVDAGTERCMEGFSYVQGSGDDHELWGQVRYHLMMKTRAIGDSTNRETTYRPTALLGLTPRLFCKHRAEFLACSREKLVAVVVKLVSAARETEQTATASDRDGLHVGAWGAPPSPVLKVGGRVLLCIWADLPRHLN